MSILIHLLVIALVLLLLVWIVRQVPIPEPFQWIAWAIIVIIAIVALLPVLGIHLPA